MVLVYAHALCINCMFRQAYKRAVVNVSQDTSGKNEEVAYRCHITAGWRSGQLEVVYGSFRRAV